MARPRNRREFIRDLGIGAAALPFVLNLPSLGFANQQRRKQRLVVMFSPNGVVPSAFWPDEEGTNVHAQGKPQAARAVQGPHADPARRLRQGPRRRRQPHARHRLPADRHRAVPRQHPGRLRHARPAGPAGISIDQEIKNFLQNDPATRTRFGSLEFGVMVPDRADTWTRMVYAGPNKPIAPIDDPYQMFAKLYGRMKDQESLKSILDDLQDDLRQGRRRRSAPRTASCSTSTPRSSARWSRS